MTSRKRLSAGLLATALAAGGAVVAVGTTPGSGGDELPPPPPVLEMSALDPIIPDDGLERLVVTVPSVVGGSETATGTEGTNPDDPVDSTGRVEPDAPAGDDDEPFGSLPAEAERIVVRDGRLGYLDGAGDFTALDGDHTVSNDDDDGDGDGEGSTLADTLAGLPGVESVEPISEGSFAVRTSEPERVEELTDLGITVSEEMYFALSDDPYEPYQWLLDNTGSNLSGISSLPNVEQTPDADTDGVEARLGATGRGVVVAIVDSGVDLTHPELAHAAWVNPGEDCDSGSGNGIDDDGNGYVDDCSGWDFGDNDRQMFDGSNNAHGTHVAGIVAARSGNGQGVAGVAPDAKIMDLKVSDSWGAIPSSSIARAIRYAVDNGADVVNLSLGSQPGAPLASAAEMAAAVDYARINGVLLVVAAGNNGISLDSAPVYPASLNTSNMIVVGATDPTDHRTSFSNYGSALDLFAPGLYILSTTPNGQLAFQSGTSQASPTVAGAAALAVESLGTSNPSAVIDRLTASADSLPQLHGQAANPLRVNAARAVGVAVGAVGTPDGSGDAGGSAGSVGSVTVRGLAGDETGRVSASIAIAVEDEALDQPFQWEASLFALQGGRLFAIPDHDVTAGPTGDAEPVVTDERGSVFLAADVSQSAQWESVLPGGTYALLIEAVPESDPDMRLGDGFLATFAVAGESPDDDASGSDPGTGSGDGSGSDSGSDPGDDPDAGTDGDSPSGDSGDGGGGSGSGDESGGDSGSGSDSGGGGGSGGGSTGGTSGGSTGGTSGSGGDSGSDSGGGSGSGGGSTGGTSGGSTGGTSGSGGGSGSGSGDTGDSGGSTGGGSTGPSDGSDSGVSGDWAVVDLSPQLGFVDTYNIVYVFGSFSEPVTVWFGNSPAETVSQSETLLIVQTDRRAQPGVVDVSLRRQADEVLRLPQAYTFVSLDGDGGGTGGSDPDAGSGGGSSGAGGGTSTGGSSGGSAGGSDGPVGDAGDPGDSTGDTGDSGDSGGSTGGDDPSSGDGSTGDSGGSTGGDDPSSGDGSTGDAGGSTGGDGSDGAGDPETSGPRPRASINGDPVELDNGLIGTPVRGVNVVGPIPSCGLDACRARRV